MPPKKADSANFPIESVNAFQMHGIFMNVCKMLKNRGGDPDLLDPFIAENHEEFQARIELTNNEIPPVITGVTKDPDSTEKNVMAYVIFYPIDRVSYQEILGSIRFVLESQKPPAGYIRNVIFVATAKSRSKLLKHLSNRPLMDEYGPIIYETFEIEFFYDDKVSNEMVPPQRAMLKSEIAEYKIQNPRIDLERLPVMGQSDAIRRYYGWAPGTMVEVLRDHETNGQQYAYRVVKSGVDQIIQNQHLSR